MSNDAIRNRGQLQSRGAQQSVMADRTLLRLSATLLFGGVLLSLLAGVFHHDQAPANNHPAAFAEYASSGTMHVATCSRLTAAAWNSR